VAPQTSARAEAPAANPAQAEAAPDAGAAAGSGSGAAAALDEPKFNLEAMLVRERDAVPLVPVLDPKGRWRASIESRRAPLVATRDGIVSIRISLGKKDELRCEVHDGQVNPGAAVANLLGAAGGSITLEEVVTYRVGHASRAPVLFVRAGYSTRQTPPLAGELKLAVSPGPQYSFVCLHDELGYRETFARIVEGLVSSFEAATPGPTPQYSAVWRQQVKEANTGYTWERIFADPDGYMSSFTSDVMIAQLASGELRIKDDMAAEVHDRFGIVRANFLSVLGTSRVYEIAVEREPGTGVYNYRGALEGKPLQGKLEPRTPLTSQYEVMLHLQKALAGKAPLTFRRDEYRPRLDPTHVLGVDYTLDTAAQTLTRKASSHADVLTLVDGYLNGSRVQSGPNVFVGTLLDRYSTLGGEPGVTVGGQPVPAAGSPLPLAERRRNFETHVFADTDHTPAKQPPAGVLSKVTYAAPLGANVAYVTPARSGKKRPAVIWIGGGLDWSIGEWAWNKAPRDNDRSARAFREAGLTLMLPALRGSNENPGKNECFLGEVDDVIAAADYLAARQDVDPARIYLAGHATGGTLALLTAATTERFRAVFAFGPVSDARQYGTPAGGGCLPADASADELALRAPVGFVGTIRTPTFVFEGGVGGNADAFDQLRDPASRNVHFTVVSGLDDSGVLAPGTEAIARAINRDQVDDEHLVIEAPGTKKEPSKTNLPPAR
jgi:acetyl esterase/lipase